MLDIRLLDISLLVHQVVWSFYGLRIVHHSPKYINSNHLEIEYGIEVPQKDKELRN